MRLDENPSDFLHLVRLLPDGTVEPDFQIGRLDSQYPFGWYVPPAIVEGILVPDSEDEVFFLHGVFSHYNDTAQAAITAINDQGYIQNNYFQNQGATMNAFHPDDPLEIDGPAVYAGKILEDGSILFGGSFSDFMGVERYSMVKLNQGTVGTSDRERLEGKVKVYPNPARDRVTVQLVTERSRSNRIESLRIVDLSGRSVASYPWNGADSRTLSGGVAERSRSAEVDISDLASCLYLLQVIGPEVILGMERLVID